MSRRRPAAPRAEQKRRQANWIVGRQPWDARDVFRVHWTATYSRVCAEYTGQGTVVVHGVPVEDSPREQQWLLKTLVHLTSLPLFAPARVCVQAAADMGKVFGLISSASVNLRALMTRLETPGGALPPPCDDPDTEDESPCAPTRVRDDTALLAAEEHLRTVRLDGAVALQRARQALLKHPLWVAEVAACTADARATSSRQELHRVLESPEYQEAYKMQTREKRLLAKFEEQRGAFAVALSLAGVDPTAINAQGDYVKVVDFDAADTATPQRQEMLMTRAALTSGRYYLLGLKQRISALEEAASADEDAALLAREELARLRAAQAASWEAALAEVQAVGTRVCAAVSAALAKVQLLQCP